MIVLAFELTRSLTGYRAIVTLGIHDDNGQQKASLDLYRDKFQVHFLAETEEYYKKESQAFLADNSISDYLKKVETRLEEESRRVDLYLHSSTNKGVRTLYSRVLIRGTDFSSFSTADGQVRPCLDH